MDLISIIVPVYNSKQYINRCLDSLVKQTYENIEIIIVDDGSNDGSLEILKLYSAKDKRIKLFRKENGGASSARNYGLDKANGKYILFIDIDDYVEFNMVEKMATKINDDKNCIVFSDNDEIYHDKVEHRKLFNNIENESKLNRINVMREIASGRAGLVCCKLVSKSIIDKYGIRFNENIKICEDQLFFLEVCQYADKFCYIEEYLYHYDRRNENSITIKYQNKAYENHMYVFNEIEKIFINNNFISKEDVELLANRITESLWFCIKNEIQTSNIFNTFSRCSKVINIFLESYIDEKYIEYINDSSIGKIILKGINSNNPILVSYVLFFIIKVWIPLKNYIRYKLRRNYA